MHSTQKVHIKRNPCLDFNMEIEHCILIESKDERLQKNIVINIRYLFGFNQPVPKIFFIKTIENSAGTELNLYQITYKHTHIHPHIHIHRITYFFYTNGAMEFHWLSFNWLFLTQYCTKIPKQLGYVARKQSTNK